LAYGLLNYGRRRVRDRSGWVKAPICTESGPPDPTATPFGEPIMWTKPEAEIVAVTMEVTAYVATL
jgi:coenzyme PQQ precursor peptide PqqA